MADTAELAERVERVLELPTDELTAELPDVLDELEGQVDVLALENPLLLADVIDRVGDVDVAAFAAENPDTVDQFQELQWQGVELLAQFSPDVQQSIEADTTVNFEATDAPMASHLELDAETGSVSGGAGLATDPDLEIRGPANTLTALTTGQLDPVSGYEGDQFEMDGSEATGDQLATTMGKLAEKLPSN
ncbi:SCP2 sterol-binding domain-containing protein [Halorientalis sp.]|jgi:putative sterol carrier protein|uniref:SCP2 sterol-binding domain-containing protein n=1 Tax=Halorientalis sp. TaxID=1931229 RepID=UPI00260519AB|nr:SCP2 sterol-binding domain-containing protein [Halorientalis sp.]